MHGGFHRLSSINLLPRTEEGDDREERKEGRIGSSSSSVLFIPDRKVEKWIEYRETLLHYSWSWSSEPSSYDFS